MKLAEDTESTERTFLVRFVPKVFPGEFQLQAVRITITKRRNFGVVDEDNPAFYQTAECTLTGVGLTTKGQPDKREAASSYLGTADMRLAFGQALVNVLGGELAAIVGSGEFRARAIAYSERTFFGVRGNRGASDETIRNIQKQDIVHTVDNTIALAEQFLRGVECR